MCCRVFNLVQTLEVIVTEPAIPAERSEAKVPNAPDGQIPLGLWPEQDPNLHQLGIYKFEIEANKLNQVLRAAVLLRRGTPFLTIEVSTSALKCIAQTKDASFVISASTPLLSHAEIGSAPLAFEVDRNVIMDTIRHFAGQLAFTFDRHSSSLEWTGKGENEGEPGFCIGARRVPSPAPEAGLRQLAVISREVGGGISYAATLIGRKEPPNFPYEGVIVEGGSILGGYYCGASRCRSSVLPESLVLSVPKEHVANAVALCSRSAGEVEVLETDSRIYLRTPNIEGFWNRIDQRSSDLLNKPFEVPPLQTVLVDTRRLQNMTCAMAALFEENLQVTVENRGASVRLELSGSSKIGKGMMSLEGRIVGDGAGIQRPWDLTFIAKDLRDAVQATSTTDTLLGVLERGLFIQSEGSEAEYKTVLLGRERQ
jgi:hypothetical protein